MHFAFAGMGRKGERNLLCFITYGMVGDEVSELHESH